MPASYFYHLAFELYPSEDPQASASTPPSQAVYLPPQGTDIFEADLPVHTTRPLGSSPTESSALRRITTADSVSSNLSKVRTISQPAAYGPRPDPQSLASPLSCGTNDKACFIDFRFGRISIESINMDQGLLDITHRPRAMTMTQATSADSSTSGGPSTRASFIPADPKSTDVGWGVVHLYRDVEETPGIHDVDYIGAASAESITFAGQFKEEECSTLCILAIPSYMMPSDLLGWAGEQTREDVSHFRLIRTGKVNRYMVLMKFRSAKKARQWRNDYNGRAFSSMEPEYAHVVFVQSITFQTDSNAPQPSSFPSMTDDPFIPRSQGALKTPTPGSSENPLGAALSMRPIAPPPPNLVELPTCPVCLERMDETTGLLTILCQHVFHCDCLSKWRGSGCPVCRYTQHGPMPGALRATNSSSDTGNACSVCQSEQNLWICLICGNVGCGRYDAAHAFAHFEETGHAYAMDIATQHVWDYIGDGYVHRLIQNKADGKMLDLPDAYNGSKKMDGGMSAMGADMVPREKMDAMGNEYAYLLQSQLENQRSYFEDQLERALDKASKAATAADKAAIALDDMTSAFSQLRNQQEESQSSIQALERDLDRALKKADKTDTLAKRLAKDWKEEKTVNEGLMDRLRSLDVKIKEAEAARAQAEAERRDLEEQNRDLSFFISGGEKLQELKEQGEEIEGQIEVPLAQASGSGKGKRKVRKK